MSCDQIQAEKNFNLLKSQKMKKYWYRSVIEREFCEVKIPVWTRSVACKIDVKIVGPAK